MKTPAALFLILPVLAWGQAPVLEESSELTLERWSTPVVLAVGTGNYRVEATELGAEPVEIVVERAEAGVWTPAATNRTLRGGLEAWADWTSDGGAWRVRPVQPGVRTVILRLKRAAFAALRDSLKTTLSALPGALPLRKRFELPRGTGGSSLTAAAGKGLLVGWLNRGRAEVWNSAGRLGAPFGENLTALRLEDGGAVAAAGERSWAWSGQQWIPEASAPPTTATPLGLFRYELKPFPRVLRQSEAGWTDLRLPQNRAMDELRLGFTDDGLYVLLASSRTADRELYSFRPEAGWQALPPPPSQGPPEPGLWDAAGGAGLIQLEGHGTGLLLRQFDGKNWLPPLDLSPLAPEGARSAVLLGPSDWSRSGTLVVVTDRLAVYDLP